MTRMKALISSWQAVLCLLSQVEVCGQWEQKITCHTYTKCKNSRAVPAMFVRRVGHNFISSLGSILVGLKFQSGVMVEQSVTVTRIPAQKPTSRWT